MRNLTFFLFILVCFPGYIQAQTQLTKKLKKEIETDIRFQFKFGEYQQVCKRTHGLASHYDGRISMDVFLLWEESSYRLRDYALSSPMLEYYQTRIHGTKHQKKLAPGIISRLDTLFRMSQMVHRHMELLRSESHMKMNEKLVVLDSMLLITDHYWQTWFDRMATAYALKDFKKAIECGIVIDQIHPDYKNTNNIIAYSYYQLGDYDSGMKYLKKIKTLDQESRGLFAWTYFMKQDYRKSLKYLDMVLSEDNTGRRFWGLKMQSHEKLGEYEMAFDAGIHIARMKPDTLDHPVMVIMGRCLYKLDGYKVDRLNDLIDKYPDVLIFHYLRMRFLDPEKEEQYAMGLRDFDYLFSYGSTDQELYYLKGNFIFNSGLDMDKRRLAENEFVKSIELEPTHFESHDKLNRLFMWKSPKTAKYHKSNTIRDMRNWTQIYPDSGRAYYYLALAFDLADNGSGSMAKYQDSTIKYLDMALDKGMDSLSVITKRMYFRVGYGRTLDDEIRDLEWIIANVTSYKKNNAQYRLADIYVSREQYHEALDIYEKILEEDPSSKQYVKPKMRKVQAKM